jgi:hypothetical protein
MMFRNFNHALYNAKGDFLTFTPGPTEILALRLRKYARVGMAAVGIIGLGKRIKETKKSELVGTIIGQEICSLVRKPIKKIVLKGLMKSKDVPLNERHLINPKRSWFKGPERLNLVVVYHDASRAGKHLDIHFSNGTSLIMRVSGKPVESEIKYHKGKLTQNSIKALMKHLKDEINNNSRVPQNWDHNPEEAQMTWLKGQGPTEGYGSGETRQIIHESEVQVLKVGTNEGQVSEMYAPGISPKRRVYTHKLYHGTEKKAPILIFGTMTKKAPKFMEKPDLKYIQGEDVDKFLAKTDRSCDTIKEDGAACHVYIDEHGTKVFSPRESVETKDKIEYTGKIPNVANVKCSDYVDDTFKIKAMGEFIAYHPDGTKFTVNEVAGLLNSDALVPEGVKTQILLYRMDEWKKTNGQDLDFWESRSILEQIASAYDDSVEVVALKPWSKSQTDGDEGTVGIPHGGNLWNAYKLKWRDEPLDLEVIEVGFKPGPSSTPDAIKIAGELLCKDKDGDTFKIGPGQFGNREECLEVMNNPKAFIGRVMCTEGLRGHKGRSLKFRHWHQDKGKV